MGFMGRGTFDTDLAFELTLAETAGDWLDPHRHVVPDDLESMAPGPALGAILASVDRSRLNGHDAVRVMQADARMESYFAALKYQSMAEVAFSPSSAPDADVVRDTSELEFASDEIGSALHLTRRSADVELGFALSLQASLPRVAEALRTGRLDVRRAKVFDRWLADADVETIDTACDRLLDAAEHLTTGQLRARLQRLVMEVDPDSTEEKRRRSVEERVTFFEPNPEGTADLYAYGIPVEEAARAGRHINGLAYGLKRAGDERSIDQLRVDVLIDLLQGKGHRSSDGGGGGGVHMTVSLETLAGLSEKPGELDGFAPVAADVARHVARTLESAEWTASVTCSHGGIVHVGTVRRRPSPTVSRYVRAHHSTCVYPGCRMPSVDCDLDHRRPWSKGGPTCSCQLAPLCGRHHRCKDEGGWKLERIHDGHRWTSPLGHRYVTQRGPP